ncbi:unnamed protein product [Enterobius vermicularis]|uniref:Uncharacterized protein n=1 Tax=Enterobius vermicularis TaxID=51028 RepID=A0A0N4VME7_ENTVE|nr:unnamed protein product [Enterobius vermicularis]
MSIWPTGEQRLPPLSQMMRTLRTEFQLVIATYNNEICLPPNADENLKRQLIKDEIRDQRVFLEYMKLHIRDLEDQLKQREAGVSFLANAPKPERQKEDDQKRSPQAGEQETRNSRSHSAAGKRRLFKE